MVSTPCSSAQNISIHALREEGDRWILLRLRCSRISIHALREEGDIDAVGVGGLGQLISIHALREEGDARSSASPAFQQNFYPRPPRGGRHGVVWQWRDLHNFYPRPPRGGRPCSPLADKTVQPISIHALREEGDSRAALVNSLTDDFYPRPPRGGRRQKGGETVKKKKISIHALREEGDAVT